MFKARPGVSVRDQYCSRNNSVATSLMFNFHEFCFIFKKVTRQSSSLQKRCTTFVIRPSPQLYIRVRTIQGRILPSLWHFHTYFEDSDTLVKWTGWPFPADRSFHLTLPKHPHIHPNLSLPEIDFSFTLTFSLLLWRFRHPCEADRVVIPGR